MLVLQVNRNRILRLDLEVEQVYCEILRKKNELKPENLSEQAFLELFPAKLWHKTAKYLHNNPQATSEEYVQGHVSLIISRDADTGLVRVELHTFRKYR